MVGLPIPFQTIVKELVVLHGFIHPRGALVLRRINTFEEVALKIGHPNRILESEMRATLPYHDEAALVDRVASLSAVLATDSAI